MEKRIIKIKMIALVLCSLKTNAGVYWNDMHSFFLLALNIFPYLDKIQIQKSFKGLLYTLSLGCGWWETFTKYTSHLLHWENCISISLHIEWDMIVRTVFLLILNQIEFHLVQNRKESCHHDHIPFNLKGNGNKVFSVCCTCLTHSWLLGDEEVVCQVAPEEVSLDLFLYWVTCFR